MVWIHGGNWFMGSGNDETDLYGPGHLLSRDIVLVTINYRVGALGKIQIFIHGPISELFPCCLAIRFPEYGRY